MTTRAHFDSLIEGLRSVESFSDQHVEGGYDILPRLHHAWKDSPQRLLVVLESLDIADIKAKRLVIDYHAKEGKGNATSVILRNVIRLAWKGLRNHAAEFEDVEAEDDFPFALGVINFNAARSFHLHGKARDAINTGFAQRVSRFIQRSKPTHVLVCGVNAAAYLLPNVQDLKYKCGWVFDHTFGKVECKVTPTLDLELLYSTKSNEDNDSDDDSSEADADSTGDLLYYVTRNLTNLIAGRHLYSLAKVKPHPVYVDTRDKFIAMMRELKEAEVIAVDTETANLESYRNAIYMIQFATTWKKAYVVPVSHPKTPFDSEDIAYINRVLRTLFGSTRFGRKKFITQNGKFDTRIYRALLGLRFIPHTILEIQAGEHLLDENLSLFARSSGRILRVPPQGGLQSIFAAYNNDWYLTAPFSKEERSNIGNVDPDDPDLLNYCSCDAQSIYGIYLQQRRRARATRVLDPNTSKPTRYLPFFERHLEHIMSATVHSLSALEQNGSSTDIGYMIHLLGQNSPLKKILADVQRESQANPNIQEANQRLLKAKGAASQSLFGKSLFVFEWSKPDARRVLFLELMKLVPPGKTDTGQPAIDKAFVAKYKELPEVDLYSRFQRASKLLSTYVRGWYRKIQSELDSAKDGKLRAAYDFFRVVTGRLSSFDPNLQNVPSRGELVKIIKRMFVTRKGYLGVRFDYNAHEIRVWSIAAKDMKLAAAFKVGQKLRQLWIQDPTPEIAGKMKKEGDLHILNVHRFFGIWVDKAHKLRDAVKAIVFGSIYGKSVRTLGRDLYYGYISGLDEDRKKAKKAYLEAKEKKADDQEALHKKWKEAEAAFKRPEKDLKAFQQEAQEIMDKMFSEFEAGARQLEGAAQQAGTSGTLMSPLGRRRNLYRVFTGIRSFLASAERRAKNAPIQGMASELGMLTGHLILEECNNYLEEGFDEWPLFSRVVHDALYYEVPYAFVIPFIHITQYMATYGVSDYVAKVFDWPLTVEPEIEMEFSAREDHSFKWDWSLPQMKTIIEGCLKDQVEMGLLKADEVEDVTATIFAPWKDKETRRALQEKYPLLGVKDLDKQLRAIAASIPG